MSCTFLLTTIGSATIEKLPTFRKLPVADFVNCNEMNTENRVPVQDGSSRQFGDMFIYLAKPVLMFMYGTVPE